MASQLFKELWMSAKKRDCGAWFNAFRLSQSPLLSGSRSIVSIAPMAEQLVTAHSQFIHQMTRIEDRFSIGKGARFYCRRCGQEDCPAAMLFPE